MNGGAELGFNTKRVDVITGGFGIRLLENLIFKGEYSRYDFSLVKGASSVVRGRDRKRNYGGVAFSLGF